eukprot:357461-Chlamydomonas_euryale.AAC.4
MAEGTRHGTLAFPDQTRHARRFSRMQLRSILKVLRILQTFPRLADGKVPRRHGCGLAAVLWAAPPARRESM